MGRDEQIEEREVLDSIFPDEITGNIRITRYDACADKLLADISDSSYRVSIALDVTFKDGDDTEPRMRPDAYRYLPQTSRPSTEKSLRIFYF